MLEIGGIKIPSDIVAAPIAGFSDVGYRRLAARYGAGITFTEMVSAKGLCYNNKGTELLLATTDEEKCTAVQLFGSDPEFMYRAAADERLEKFDIIDINMGCPVKKIFGNGEGSALMRDPALIRDVVAAVKDGGRRPVTVKLRAGIDMGIPLAEECAAAAELGGADAITVHARYREQFYSGSADHSVTRAVKECVSIPVIANGDITDKESLARTARESGADAFMVARASIGRQCLFSELADRDCEFSAKQAALEHIETDRRFMPDKVVTNVMKLHLCHYAKGTRQSKAVRGALAATLTLDDIFRLIEEYLV